MNKAIPKAEPDWRQKREENVSVLQQDPDARECPACGKRAVVFNVHFFKENRVEDLCKACTVLKAGGEEKVSVRTTQGGLGKVWDEDRKRAVPPPVRHRK